MRKLFAAGCAALLACTLSIGAFAHCAPNTATNRTAQCAGTGVCTVDGICDGSCIGTGDCIGYSGCNSVCTGSKTCLTNGTCGGHPQRSTSSGYGKAYGSGGRCHG